MRITPGQHLHSLSERSQRYIAVLRLIVRRVAVDEGVLPVILLYDRLKVPVLDDHSGKPP